MSPEENTYLLEEIKNGPDNKNNLDRLIEQLKRRAGVVPFVGAGLSMPFDFPGWGAFLTNQAEGLSSEGKKQILEYIDQGKYEEAAEVLSTTLGHNFDKAIKENSSS